MGSLLRELLEKWAHRHKWETFKEMEVDIRITNHSTGRVEVSRTDTHYHQRCKQCGELKHVVFKEII